MSVELLTLKGPKVDGFPYTLSVDVQNLVLDQVNTEIQLMRTRLLVATPSLWTYLDPSVAGRNFVDLLLKRSQGSTLDIAVHGEEKHVAAELTRQLLHRARTLSMPGHPTSMDSHFNAPAPSLEELTVNKSLTRSRCLVDQLVPLCRLVDSGGGGSGSEG